MFKRFASDRKKQSSQKIITFHFKIHPVGDKTSTIHLENLPSIFFWVISFSLKSVVKTPVPYYELIYRKKCYFTFCKRKIYSI